MGNFIIIGLIVVVILFIIFGKKLFKRLGFIAKSKANEEISKLEEANALALIEQSIRDLQEKIGNAISAQAKVMGTAKSYEAKSLNWTEKANEYERKANALADKHERGELDADKFKELLVKCLNEQENAKNQGIKNNNLAIQQKKSAEEIGSQIKKMNDIIKESKENLETLKAQKEVSALQKDVAKNMSDLSTDGTKDLINRLSNSINADKFEAQAYMEMADDAKSTDEEINDILSQNSPTANDELINNFMTNRNK